MVVVFTDLKILLFYFDSSFEKIAPLRPALYTSPFDHGFRFSTCLIVRLWQIVIAEQIVTFWMFRLDFLMPLVVIVLVNANSFSLSLLIINLLLYLKLIKASYYCSANLAFSSLLLLLGSGSFEKIGSKFKILQCSTFKRIPFFNLVLIIVVRKKVFSELFWIWIWMRGAVLKNKQLGFYVLALYLNCLNGGFSWPTKEW